MWRNLLFVQSVLFVIHNDSVCHRVGQCRCFIIDVCVWECGVNMFWAMR